MMMARKRKIAKDSNAIPISVRFDKEKVELLDLLTDNRSEFIRDATWDKISKKMENE